MRRISKTIITLMTLVVTVSLIGNVLGFANGESEYETVGREISQTSYITTFLVPALVIIGIFGAMIILGVIRISFKSDANESA